jgi:hypothetical protein
VALLSHSKNQKAAAERMSPASHGTELHMNQDRKFLIWSLFWLSELLRCLSQEKMCNVSGFATTRHSTVCEGRNTEARHYHKTMADVMF